MKSRTSFCNGAMLRRLAHKCAPLWGVYLLVWIIFLPVLLYSRSWIDVRDLRELILSAGAYASQPVGACYGLVCACALFAYQYTARSANFYAALPMTRQTAFCTRYLAGLLFAVIPQLITLALCLPLVLMFRESLILRDLGSWFAAMTLSYLFYYSFAVLLAMIVGNLIALPVLYGVLNFTAVVVEAVVESLLQYFVYGLYFTGDFIFDWASPLYYTVLQGDGPTVKGVWDIPGQRATDYVLEGWPMLLIMGAVGAVFAVIAFLLHRRRRAESAGDVIAIRHLKPVFLWCFTVGCGLVLGFGLSSLLISGSIGTEDFFPVLLCVLFGAFLGYFAGQAMLHRSLRVFRKQYFLNYGVAAVLMAAVLLCVRFDLFGYARYVPQQDQIRSASLSIRGNYSEDPAFISQVTELHSNILRQQKQTERGGADFSGTSCYIRYQLQSGKTVSRRYILPSGGAQALAQDSLIRQYTDAVNDPDYKLLRSLPRDYEARHIQYCEIYSSAQEETVYLTPDEAYHFLKTALEPDLLTSSMEDIRYLEEPAAEPIETRIHIQIEFSRDLFPGGDGDRYYFFTVPGDAGHTLKFASQHGLKPAYSLDAE